MEKKLNFSRFSVILVRPERMENIGSVARAMKNTGFNRLRIVGLTKLDEKARVTAVHAADVLNEAMFFPSLEEAVAELNIVFASTAKKRKNAVFLSLNEAVEKMLSFPRETKIGLVFGPERTGLTSGDLLVSNFCFTIPQACKQPSFNLAGAVLITLYQIYSSLTPKILSEESDDLPCPWHEQKECLQRILDKLSSQGFIHEKNRKHVTEMVFNLFGRLAMTEREKNFLLAVFSKANKKTN